MNESTEELEKLLDRSAIKAIQDAVQDLREILLLEANKRADGGKITEADVNYAYKRLYPSKDSFAFADAQSIISQALRENRRLESVSYLMAIILFVFGLVLLSNGVTHSDIGIRIGCLIGGPIVELLILLPFRFVINSRRHNMAMRMLGLIIDRVDDPKKLAPLLKDTFLSVVLGMPPFKVGSNQP